MSAQHGGTDRGWIHAADGYQHLDGIPWTRTEPPRRWHRCKPQTQGWTNIWNGIIMWRQWCACGATREGIRGHWDNRNSRQP